MTEYELVFFMSHNPGGPQRYRLPEGAIVVGYEAGYQGRLMVLVPVPPGR